MTVSYDTEDKIVDFDGYQIIPFLGYSGNGFTGQVKGWQRKDLNPVIAAGSLQRLWQPMLALTSQP